MSSEDKAERSVTIDVLYSDDEGREFWWKQCEKDGCSNQVNKANDRFCYPHISIAHWIMARARFFVWHIKQAMEG